MSSLLRAFSSTGSIYASACYYHDAGFSVIPCRVDKTPALPHWIEYQERRAPLLLIDDWFMTHNPFIPPIPKAHHHSIGVVCGQISGNLMVIDLDGVGAVHKFYEQFPNMSGKTLTVKTGSGKGIHLYFTVDNLPENINVRVDGIGGFEMRGNGQYVIAPPSPHESGHNYETVALREIAHVENLDDVREWFESMRAITEPAWNAEMAAAAKPVDLKTSSWKKHYLESLVSQELARIEIASEGNRNNSLFYATLRLANYCAGGELSRYDCEARLLTAARKANIPPKEAERTINSGFNIGWKYPKQVPPPSEE